MSKVDGFSKYLLDKSIDDVQMPEFLNTIFRVPVMLLRNLDLQNSLCNGTRLVITRMRKYVLEGKGNIW